MGVAHHLTTIGGISSVTTSYWFENLHLSFGVSIEKALINLNSTYGVIYSNGLEELLKGTFEKSFAGTACS